MSGKEKESQPTFTTGRRQFLKTAGLLALGPQALLGPGRLTHAAGAPRETPAAGGVTLSGLDERLWKTSTPSASTITWQQVSPGDGGTCFYLRIHPLDPNHIIESKDMGGTYITIDGSRTYQSVNDPDQTFPRLHYLNGIDFCLARPDIGYAVSDYNGAFKTTDRGRSWTPLNTRPIDTLYGETGRLAPFSAVTVDPENPDEVWLGTGFRRVDVMYEAQRSTAGLAHSSDGGRTWTHVADAIPPGALLRKLCITPAVSPAGRVLLAATDRGFFLSRDDGKTWTPKMGQPGKSLPHDQLRDMDLCWDRAHGRIVIAVSMNTEVRPEGEGLAFAGGVWRSEDLGESWEDATGNLRLPAQLLLKDPNLSPKYVIAQRLLWREFFADPANHPAMEAYSPKFDTEAMLRRWELFRRKRQGALTQETARRLNHTTHILPPFQDVRLDPRDPQVIYTSIHEKWPPFGVWKTRNGGQSWICTVRGAQGWDDPDWAAYCPAGAPIHNVAQVWTTRHPMNWGTPNARFGLWDVRIFDIAKSNPDVLYFHTHRVTYRSDDGAATWRDISNHSVPGSDGGFMGNGNSNMCVFDLAFDPKGSSKILFWMADCGIKTSRDGGRSMKAVPGADFGTNQWIHSAAFDPDDPDRFYLIFHCSDYLPSLTGTYFLESRDFGRTIEGVSIAPDGSAKVPPQITAFDSNVNRMLVDPRSPREKRRFIIAHSALTRSGYDTPMRSAGSKGIFVSEDGGKSWQAHNRGLESATLNIMDLAPDPRNFDVLYAAMMMRVQDSKAEPGGLYVSRDGARSWSKLGALSLLNVSQVAVQADGTLYAAGGLATEYDQGGGVYRSRDGGKHWEQILAAPRVSCLAVCPTNPKLIYCAVDTLRKLREIKGAGIWRSADGGKNWQRINKGLATNFRFTCMRFNPNAKGEIWIGTFNSGYYRGSDPAA